MIRSTRKVLGLDTPENINKLANSNWKEEIIIRGDFTGWNYISIDVDERLIYNI